MIDENLKIQVIEENNNADFENYKKRLKNKTLELLSLKDEAITQIKASKVSGIGIENKVN
ncbi:hypothetical protein [Candidatus Karelsulcia muelleri]|uniref:hypothetical protein n=1 Tax=Candidatus Karelsulcia muelleri TaxID=336810 RepID=UPI000D7C2D53|nr:hypothetical protein [Candidatus Karelsulcia muelleri]